MRSAAATVPPGEWDQTFAGVYRVSPDLGALTLLVNDFLTPNGIAFSPDESVLYINDTARRHIRAFDIAPNGTLARQTDRVFADLSGPEPGAPDGMKVDSAGNVFCGGAGGIYILDPKGKKLGRIVHGYMNTSNIAFGGDDWKTVYFCTRMSLGSFKVKIAGVPLPAVHGHSLLPLARGETERVRDYAVSGLQVGADVEWALRTPEFSFLLPLRTTAERVRGAQLYVKPDDRWEVNDVRQHHLEEADAFEHTLRAFVRATTAPGPWQLPPLAAPTHAAESPPQT